MAEALDTAAAELFAAQANSANAVKSPTRRDVKVLFVTGYADIGVLELRAAWLLGAGGAMTAADAARKSAAMQFVAAPGDAVAHDG